MDLDQRVAEFWARKLPGWIDRVTDTEFGGIRDRLDRAGQPFADDPKTTLVQARILFTMAHLELAGHGGPAVRDAAKAAHAFLMGPLRHPDGGWRRAVARDGAPTGDRADDLRDCYDHAFVVLATATWGRINPDARTGLDEAWGVVQTLFAEHGSGRLVENSATPPALPRRQNPHMHMFEACLFAWEATGDPRWQARADLLLEVFEHNLFDAATGTVREFLSPDLGPLGSAQGAIREPGHHCEWVWLLNLYVALGGTRPVDDARAALLAFADTFGHATSGPLAGAAYDEVAPDGRVVSETHLLWPQTEAVKAYLSEYRRTGDVARLDQARKIAGLMFDHYIDTDAAFWINQRDARAQVIWSEALSRLLYHIAVAFTEGERLNAWRSR